MFYLNRVLHKMLSKAVKRNYVVNDSFGIDYLCRVIGKSRSHHISIIKKFDKIFKNKIIRANLYQHCYMLHLSIVQFYMIKFQESKQLNKKSQKYEVFDRYLYEYK